MSAAAPEPDYEDEVAFTVAVPEADHSKDRVVFRLDDDPETLLVAHRPKRAKMLKVLRSTDLGGVADLEAAGVLETMLHEVCDAPSVEYLTERFDDPEDDLDLNVVRPIVQELIRVWYGGPTGSRRESGPSRPRSGVRSTETSHSGGSTP